MLKRNYLPLLCFLPIWIGAIAAVSFFFPSYTMRLTVNCVTIGMAVLSFIIYKTENVYYYNSISFEQAEEAGSDRRRAYAWAHFVRFLILAIALLFLSLVFSLLGFHQVIDFSIGIAALIAVAISMMWISL